MSFLMYKLFIKIKNLPHLSAVDHYLVEVTHNLTAFYHLLQNMALLTYLLIHTSIYAQVGLNYILSYSFFFKKNSFSENLIHVSKTSCYMHKVKGIILIVEKKPHVLVRQYT